LKENNKQQTLKFEVLLVWFGLVLFFLQSIATRNDTRRIVPCPFFLFVFSSNGNKNNKTNALFVVTITKISVWIELSATETSFIDNHAR
jgi:hypothetical protein